MNGARVASSVRQPVRARWDGGDTEIDVIIDTYNLPVVPKAGGFAVAGFTCYQVTRLRDGSRQFEPKPKWVPRSGERLIGYDSGGKRVVTNDWGISVPAPGDELVALHMGALVIVRVDGLADVASTFADMTDTPPLAGFSGFVTSALVPDYQGSLGQAVKGTLYGSLRPKRLARVLVAGYLVR